MVVPSLLGIQLRYDEVVCYHGIFRLKRQAKSHLDQADSTFYRFSGLDKLLMGSDWLGYFRGKVGSQLGLDLGKLVLEDNLDRCPSIALPHTAVLASSWVPYNFPCPVVQASAAFWHAPS